MHAYQISRAGGAGASGREQCTDDISPRPLYLANVEKGIKLEVYNLTIVPPPNFWTFHHRLISTAILFTLDYEQMLYNLNQLIHFLQLLSDISYL